MNELIEMGKKYKTRDGRNVRILCTNAGMHKYVTIGLVLQEDGTETIQSWKSDGSFTVHGGTHKLDLIEVDPYEEFKNLPIDTPVWVRDDEKNPWLPRHWARLQSADWNCRFLTFCDGKSSHTADGKDDVTSWMFCTTENPFKKEGE